MIKVLDDTVVSCSTGTHFCSEANFLSLMDTMTLDLRKLFSYSDLLIEVGDDKW